MTIHQFSSADGLQFVSMLTIIGSVSTMWRRGQRPAMGSQSVTAARRAPGEQDSIMPQSIGDSRLIEMPGHLIRRLHQISFALFLDQAKAFGVTPVQYAALVAIDRHPGIDQTTLCNIIAFDRTTIGGVVGRLQRKKLISRVDGVHDRRTKALRITPAGRRLIRDIEPAVLATQRLILKPLTPRQRSAFKKMLKHLVHLNNAHSRAPWRPRGGAGRGGP